MNPWMNEHRITHHWINESMNQWTNEPLNQRFNALVNQWINESMNQGTGQQCRLFRAAPNVPVFFPTCQVKVVTFFFFSSSSSFAPRLLASSQSQWAPLDLNNHLPISVGTAGPQPGTSRVQWPPLELNRGPPEPSGHRWTSTGDLPSPVGTAGPQPPDRMPDRMPD